MKTILLTSLLFAWGLCAHVDAQTATPAVPPFTVIGTQPGKLSVVVPTDVTDGQLVALINAFRSARANGSFAKLIPPTTPRGTKGPYGAVEIFVFSDAAFATTAKLKDFMKVQTVDSPSQKAFGQSIRAYYLAPLGGDEYGSIGYESDGTKYTDRYRKLF